MDSQIPFIRQFTQPDSASPRFSDELLVVPRQETLEECASSLSAQDPWWFVDSLDDILKSRDLDEDCSIEPKESWNNLNCGNPLEHDYHDDLPVLLSKQGTLIADRLSTRDKAELVRVLGGDDAQSFVDVIDEMLDRLVPSLRRKFLSILCSICGCRGLLPRSMKIPLSYNSMNTPADHGGRSELWKCEHQGREVAIKVLKVDRARDFNKVKRRFCREVMTWKTLQHQNVLPLLGVKMSKKQLALASEWMANGNINTFVETHGDANRFELLKGVTRGLIHMHAEGIIHGNLKGTSILIDQHGHARLADFGLVTIVPETGNSMTSNPSANVGTTRWMSPELLDPYHPDFKGGQRTKASDCYGLGMVIYEVLSGQVPFARYNNFIVARQIVSGEHPERPIRTWLTDDLWEMLRLCWSSRPIDRPTIGAVFECLKEASPAWEPMPPGDSHVRIGTGDESLSTVTGPGGVPIKLALGISWPTSASISLMKIVNWDGTSHDIEQVLVAAFDADDYPDCIKVLQEQRIDPILYIDNLDKIIDNLPVDSNLRKRCIRTLSGTCGFYGVLPTSHAFAGSLSKPGPKPFASSATFDFWRLTDERHQDPVFAVKSLRVWNGGAVEKLKEKYCKEVIVSKRLSHPNTLSIEGVAPELFQFCMVSRWMEHGSVLEYVREHPEVDRLQLLIGVARGLDYLHTNGIVHGDLKSPNILIDAEGSPRIIDFANCAFTDNTRSVGASAPSYTYTIRWSAPERLSASLQAQEPTKMSDIYSLSMVIVELVTGKVPFPEYTDENVIVIIAKGERPSRPRPIDAPGMIPEVWKIAQKCWSEKADQRPEANKILQSLILLTKSDTKPPPASGLQSWRR